MRYRVLGSIGVLLVMLCGATTLSFAQAQESSSRDDTVWASNIAPGQEETTFPVSLQSVMSTYNDGVYEGEFYIFGTATLASDVVYGVLLFDTETNNLVDALSLGEETLFGFMDGARPFRYVVPSFVIGNVEARLVMYSKDGLLVGSYLLGDATMKGEGRSIICTKASNVICKAKKDTLVNLYLTKEFPFGTTTNTITKVVSEGEEFNVLSLLGNIAPGEYFIVIEKEGGLEKKIFPYTKKGEYATIKAVNLVITTKETAKLLATIESTVTPLSVEAVLKSSYGDTCRYLLSKEGATYVADITTSPCERGTVTFEVRSQAGALYDVSSYLFDMNTDEYDKETQAPKSLWFISEERKTVLSYTVLILILLAIMHLSVWRGRVLRRGNGRRV